MKPSTEGSYGYYPGCSLEKNALAYHESTSAVARLLGLKFEEVEDWNCCGASEYLALDILPAYALISRNLALAASNSKNHSLVAPCSACFLNLSKVDHQMTEVPSLAALVNEALAAGGLNYRPGSITIRHLLDVFVHDVGFDRITGIITRPLYELRVAPYYGCLISRPDYEGACDSPEYPTGLDHLLSALGAEVVDFPLKTHCCGGHMTQISEPVALELIRRLLQNAHEYDADVIATLCPMCQLNLDAYQEHVNQMFGTSYHIPILYFTQLIGLALGIRAKELGFGREFVSAKPALAKIGTSRPTAKKKSKRPKEALPMPQNMEV